MENKIRLIKGFQRYAVTNTGEVISLNYRNTRKSKELKSCINDANNLFVILINDEGKKTTRLVHRLVAQAFISNPNNFKEVYHKDKDKTNNNSTNLIWRNRNCKDHISREVI